MGIHVFNFIFQKIQKYKSIAKAYEFKILFKCFYVYNKIDRSKKQ